MARTRRKTFWLGFASNVEGDPSTNEDGVATSEWTWSQDPLAIDAAPTLVRIVGNLIILAEREDVTDQELTSQASWSFGIMCQQANTLESVEPGTPAGLSDERWLYTRHGTVTALSVARPIPTALFLIQWGFSTEHSAPYPQCYDVSVRAMRRMEDPCIFTSSLQWFTEGFSPFAGLRARFIGRALFKAS